MNVFILGTGRCGSTTFIRACQHITNYSAGHETRIHHLHPQRFAYPDRHIEADNRLSWFTGRLDEIYRDDAFYVHLRRDRLLVANSFVKRQDFGILKAYRQGILLQETPRQAILDIALDYVDCVNSNIQLFLKDKSRAMSVDLESIEKDFRSFWDRIDAQGSLGDALQEWRIRYNASS